MRNNLAVAWGSVAKRTLVQDALTSIVAPGFAGSCQSAVRPTGMQTVYFTPIKLVKFVEYLAWGPASFPTSRHHARIPGVAK